jgi:hypothetical protein
MDIPRFLPGVPFPPYTYVPGQTPHPVSDPAGHMHGEAPQPAELLVDDWPRCHAYLRGIDLFNHGYYWEAHEVWESLWHAAGRTGPVADFLKGLIKLAAAGVKTLEGSPTGSARHARRAAELFRSAIAGDKQWLDLAEPRMMGLPLRQMESSALELAAGDHALSMARAQSWPVLPIVLFPEMTTGQQPSGGCTHDE